ncbi:MAG: tRNA lysidine(34) synthetase TilS [Patulibacter sp.]
MARSPQAIEAVVVAGGLLDRSPATDGKAGRPLLLLCSPGRDSMCLLDLAVRRLGADGVRVLHVDHRLRPESGDEAAQVLGVARALGVRAVVRTAERAAGGAWGGRPAASGESGGNLHAWARELRHTLAVQEATRVKARAVASAHTRTDLVETALFRLATQPGRRALLAMRPRLPDAIAPGVALVRPLLELSRDDTLAWCRARGLHWVDDPSNADRHYARARLRHSVTPILRGLNPRYEEAVARTLRELDEERDALAALVADALPCGADAVPIDVLAALPQPVARLVVRELCERAIGSPVARATVRTAELLERATRSREPFALDIGDGARLMVRGGVLRCERSDGPAAPQAVGA